MVIQVCNLVKVYGTGTVRVTALNGINLSIQEEEYVAIMGASGSGKSTLLNIIGCLDSITSGKYVLDDVDVSSLNDKELSSIRNKKIGFIFQAFNLLPKLTALENVMLPMVYANVPSHKGKNIAKDALEKVGLKDRMNHKPYELSGGQKQRAAIARALVNNPAIILADEPTGNIDGKVSQEIMDILDNLNNEGTTILIVTHESNIVSHAKRKILFRDGNILSDTSFKI